MTDVEGEKGAISDALKRTAVKLGIGRYLYNLPAVWVPIEPWGKSHRIVPGEEPELPEWARPAGAPPAEQKKAPTDAEREQFASGVHVLAEKLDGIYSPNDSNEMFDSVLEKTEFNTFNELVASGDSEGHVAFYKKLESFVTEGAGEAE